jgi:pimeloyl-ACP methyl ester carboxylesterase
VLAVDYRGRGLSAYDPDPENYTTAVELADLVAALTALEIGRAVFIGTSRGGILTMLLAAARPAFIAGAVLNDIGPVIEAKGLLRIKGYVGKLPQPRNWSEAAEILRRIFASQFPNHVDADWQQAARLTWREQDGQWILTYDPKLAVTLDAIDIDAPLPSLWPQFDSLARVPLLVIRGGLSDLLSGESLAAMRTRRPGMEVVEVTDEGHPPSLAKQEMIERIAGFLRSCDRAARV